MNGEQLRTLCETIAQQVGIPADALSKALPFWQPNLLTIPADRAMEGLKVMLVNNTQAGKDPGKWLGAIVRYAGTSTPSQNATRSTQDAPEGCETCRYSGTIEVPHDKDWSDGRWRGVYTMVVACTCGMGQMKACQMPNIRQYEHKYPYWRNEYPMQMYVCQLRELLAKEVPHHREDRENHQRKIKRLQVLLGEVDEKPQDPWDGGSLKELLGNCVKQFS